jgi:mercuric ion transport protein
MSPSRRTSRSAAGLAGAALVALASMVCWAVPLILVSIGITGAWMSTFTILAPYKSLLVGASLVCLAYAWFSIYRAQGADRDESACVAPSISRTSRALFWLVSALVLGAIVSPYLLPVLFEA